MSISDRNSDVCSSDLVGLINDFAGNKKPRTPSSTRCSRMAFQVNNSAAWFFPIGALALCFRLHSLASAESRLSSVCQGGLPTMHCTCLGRLLNREIGRASCRERVWKYVYSARV